MDLEMFYKKEIDFDALKSAGMLLTAKYSGINSINFYSGKRERQYILLIEINPDCLGLELFGDSFSFFMMLEHGFLGYQENRDIMLRSKQKDYDLEKTFLSNWYVFFKKVSNTEYYLSDPDFKNEYIGNSEEPKNRILNLGGNMLPSKSPFLFLDYSLNSKDFIDSKKWALTKKGFEKFIIPGSEIILFPSSNRLNLTDKIPIQSKETIPVPDNTQWGQIKFRYLNDDITQVSYPGGGGPLSSNTLGLAGKPMLFEIFKLFAKSKGTLSNAKAPEKVKANVSNLRKHLKSLFPGISGRPIREYDKREGWVCNFQIDCYEVDSDSEA